MSEISERLDGHATALIDAVVAHCDAALAATTERLRGEAMERLAAQCRELVALTEAVTAADAERAQRLERLERRVSELAGAFERPRPLDIPPRNGRHDSAAVDMHNGAG
jgi:hypothetical protein